MQGSQLCSILFVNTSVILGLNTQRLDWRLEDMTYFNKESTLPRIVGYGVREMALSVSMHA